MSRLLLTRADKFVSKGLLAMLRLEGVFNWHIAAANAWTAIIQGTSPPSPRTKLNILL
jgi:hypothetical protein